MDYSYPLLSKVFNHYHKDGLDLSDFRLYSCQHLLAPQLEMYKMFIKFGLKPENIFVLGKAYSSNVEIIEELKKLGLKVWQPTFKGESFDSEHTENCQELIKDISSNYKNIILDDGGALIFEAREKSVYCAVEQTSSGFRKLENEVINFPVFNVARSKTKLTQESPIIARIIFERLKNYFFSQKIDSPKIIIIGLGPIGNAILEILSEENYDVAGFDIETDKIKLISYLKENKPNIVIGATGSPLMNELDIQKLESEHTYHLISVSSSDREFPVVSFRQNNLVHDDVKYKNIIFVNNGFPITFKGNKYESTPIEIEKTIALLTGSVLHSLSQNISQNAGIIDVPKELEEIIND